MRRRKPSDTARRTTANWCPWLEPLEVRITPAVQAFVRGGILFIQGDQAANVVGLVREGNEVRVTTNMNQAQTFENITKAVANLGAGNDNLTATIHPTPVNPNTPTPPPFDLTVDLGEGNDSFTADVVLPPGTLPPSDGSNLGIAALGGGGNDNIAIQIGAPNMTDPLVFDELTVSVGGGSGADEVGIIIINSRVEELSQVVSLGDGINTARLSSTNLVVGGLMQQNVGGGNGGDEVGIIIINNRVGELSQVVDLGDGNDTFRGVIRDFKAQGDMQGPLRGASIDLRTGLGHDHFEFEMEDVELMGGFVANTGRGNDRVVATLSEVENNYEGIPFSFLTGEGHDELSIAMQKVTLNGGGLRVDTAAGNDALFVNLSEVEFGGEAGLPTIKSGDGHDTATLAIQNVHLGKQGFVHDSGLGNDNVFTNIADTTSAGGAFQVLTGEGDDIVAGAVDQLAETPLGVIYDLGNGNDTFSTKFVMKLPPLVSVGQQFVAVMNITVLGGAGNDRIWVQTLVVAPFVIPFFYPPSYVPGARFDLKLLVDGGSGQDILFVQGAYNQPLTSGPPENAPFYVGDVEVDVLGGTNTDYVTVIWQQPGLLATIQLDALADGGAGIDAGVTSPNVARLNFEF